MRLPSPRLTRLPTIPHLPTPGTPLGPLRPTLLTLHAPIYRLLRLHALIHPLFLHLQQPRPHRRLACLGPTDGVDLDHDDGRRQVQGRHWHFEQIGGGAAAGDAGGVVHGGEAFGVVLGCDDGEDVEVEGGEGGGCALGGGGAGEGGGDGVGVLDVECCGGGVVDGEADEGGGGGGGHFEAGWGGGGRGFVEVAFKVMVIVCGVGEGLNC